MPPQASPVRMPSAGEPVLWITVAGDAGGQRDIGADREIEAGGEHHQRQARRDEEGQARLPQHVEDVAEAQEGVR